MSADNSPRSGNSVGDLSQACAAVDGVAPFNEATVLSVAAHDAPRVWIERPHALAVAFGDAPVELAVHPDERRHGFGRDLLDEVAALDESDVWAHGDVSGAQALARSVGAERVRTLLVLRRGTEPLDPRPAPDGITIRPATPADIDGVIAVNGRAFADHPEQGAMDRADFDRRAAQPWFDLGGLFVAVDGSDVIGFHWTKIEDGIGEVYVVGVDPDRHGGGLGSALTAVGVDHLIRSGVDAIDLYVEGDNDPALAVYHRIGFAEHARDVLYRLA